MSKNEGDHPAKQEDPNIYATPRTSPSPINDAHTQQLNRQRTIWMWLAMLPSLAVPLSAFFLNAATTFLFFGSLAWIGYCVSRVNEVTAELAGNLGKPTTAGCLYLSLVLINFTLGCTLIFGACLFFNKFHV